MDFDDGGVDHCVLHVRIIRHGIKKAFENITLDPIPVSLEDRVPGAEQRRQVAPRAAGSRDPQHRFNKTTVVPAAATGIGSLPPAMQFHLRPLGIAQYTAVHPKLDGVDGPRPDGIAMCQGGDCRSHHSKGRSRPDADYYRRSGYREERLSGSWRRWGGSCRAS